MDPAALSLLYVRSAKGALVPLNAIAEIREGIGPASINMSFWGSRSSASACPPHLGGRVTYRKTNRSSES
jgi:hypothetical protein